jgi:hypothetical protein
MGRGSGGNAAGRGFLSHRFEEKEQRKEFDKRRDVEGLRRAEKSESRQKCLLRFPP